MDSITVTTTLDRKDWQALLQACGRRMQERRKQLPLILRILPNVVWLGLVAFFAVVFSIDSKYFDGRTLVIAGVAFGAFFWLMAMLNRRTYAPDENGAFVGTSTFEFGPAGITATRAHVRTQMEWPMLRDVTRTSTHFFLWIDAISAYCIRIGDLPAPLTAEELEARLGAFQAAAAVAASTEPVAGASITDESNARREATPQLASVAAAAPSASEPPRLRQELLALLRISIRLPANALHLVGRDVTIAWLTVFNLLLWALLQRIEFVGEGGRVELMWWSVPELARHVVWVLAVAWLLGRLASPPLSLRRTLLLVLGFLPLLSLGWTFIGDDVPRAGIFLATVALVTIAGNYLDAGARAMTGRAQPRAVTVAIAVALGFLWFGANYTFPAGLWHSPEDYANADRDTSGREQLLFDQPARIDASIEAMAPAPAGAAGVYFVGFAGYGDQRVFAEEIGKAASVVGARYGTDRRQLLLINDRRDRESQPYATSPALRHALAGIGKRMDVERDVLFLALSSHGSSDAVLSVSNEYDLWEGLTGEGLRAMLDESGILWRVIVISACHSGSFIEHLQDERTVVLTAAAKDRTSFGCSDDRDLTYFGEAFYRDALPSTATLRGAFDAARTAIDERESKEKQSRSDPQAFFGALMEQKLAELEHARDVMTTYE